MSTPAYGAGIEIHRTHHPRVRRDPDARGASRSSRSCSARSAAGARNCCAPRAQRQAELDAGELPDFLPETRAVREGDWTLAPIPADLQDRRVEITGPVDRKMIINALNSGANVFMADFEDANSPTWDNTIEGQINLRDAIRRRIDFTVAGGQGVQAQRQDRDAARAPARLAPAGEARPGRRRADVGRALRLRPLLLPQREGAARARQRPVLLPAQAGEPPRGAAVERRRSCWRRTSSASRAARSGRPC